MMELAHSTVMIVSPDSPGNFLTKGYYGKKKKTTKKKNETTYPKFGFEKVYADIVWRGN